MGLFSKRLSMRSERRKSMAQRDLRRKSVAVARINHKSALDEARERSNEYCREASKGKLEKAARRVSFKSNKSWWQFWEKESRTIPKELELPEENESVAFEDAAIAILEQTLEFAEEKKGWGAENSVFWLNQKVKEQSKKVDSQTYIRMKATFEVEPRAVLLALIRSEFYGKTDPKLMYQREHYSYLGGRTKLLHSVYNPPAKFASPRDYVELMSYDEHPDGVIVIGYRSVENCLEELSGAVRATCHIRGIVLKPIELEKTSLFGGVSTIPASEVTYIQCVDPKVFFKALYNPRKEAAQKLLNLESIAQTIRKEPRYKKLVKKYISKPLSEDEEEE